MNLDKTIKELTNRLDEVHPYSASSYTNYQNRNDGITYWKGKKIIAGYFDPAVARQLKQLALDKDTTVQSLLIEALNDLFEKHRKQPIA